MLSFRISRQTRRAFAAALALSLLATLVAFGLLSGKAQAAEASPISFDRPLPDAVPDEVKAWVAALKGRQGLHRMDLDSNTWVLVAWGSKPTGGYAVTVENAERTASGVVVFSVELAAPGPGAIVAQAITYPYDLVVIDYTDALLAAEFAGAQWLPAQQDGIPLVSRQIFLQEPTAGSKLGRTLRVKGAAQLFEGTFHVVLEDGHKQLLNQLGTASAGGPEWGSIDMELEFPMPTSPNGHLIIMWQDAADGSWVEELAVPISFETFAPIGNGGPPSFSDIAGHWAQAAITEAVSQGMVNGYPNGTFQPEAQITRAEFIKVLLAALGIEPAGDAAEPAFHDTAEHWARGYVDEAVRRNILKIEDYEDNNFEPDNNITRLEMAIQLVRAWERAADIGRYAGKVSDFTDTSALDALSRGYIGTAVELGILTGYPDGTVRHGNEATRAEAVTVIQRAVAARE